MAIVCFLIGVAFFITALVGGMPDPSLAFIVSILLMGVSGYFIIKKRFPRLLVRRR